MSARPLKAAQGAADILGMAGLLPAILAGALALFAGWLAVLLRLDADDAPAEAAAPAPTAALVATAVPAATPSPSVVLFPSFSGVGGDAWLLTAADRSAA